VTQAASDFLKIPEAAAELGVSERTIRNWIATGQIPAVQPAGRGGAVRVDRRELLHSERRSEGGAMRNPAAGLPVDTELSDGPRRQKVIAGTRMVTPRKPLVLHENGRTEELHPGRDRFARDYPLVIEHPELFEPCDSQDAETFRRHCETAERKLRRLGTTTRATTSSRRKRFQLPDRRRERFRLP
jgi:excisionase family DNA binding protein